MYDLIVREGMFFSGWSATNDQQICTLFDEVLIEAGRAGCHYVLVLKVLVLKIITEGVDSVSSSEIR